MNKIKVAILNLLLLVLLIATITVGCIGESNNKIIKSVASPEGTYVAYLFIRDMGATTEESNQLSILKKSQKLGNSPGNIFVTFGEFDIEWIKDNELTVKRTTSGEVFKNVTEYNGVTIKYYP